MLLNDVVIRIKERSHRGDINVTTDAITSAIIRAISDCRRDVITRLPIKYLRTTASFACTIGQATYSLASNMQAPLLFRFTDSSTDYFLRKVSSEREFYEKYYNSQSPNAAPLFFFDAGLDAVTSGNRQIILWPTPDKAYSIQYVYFRDPSQTATELTTSNLNQEIPDIPAYAQGVLWKGGLYYYLKGFDDPGQVVALTDYKVGLKMFDKSEDQDNDNETSFRFDAIQNSRDPRSLKLDSGTW